MKAARAVPFLILLGCAGGSKDPVKEIRSASQAYDTLYRLCKEVGHRLAGTQNGQRAEEFALARLREYGLENVHAETFEMLGWTRGPVTLQLIEPERRTIDTVALGNTPSGTAEGTPLDLGYGTPDDFKKAGDGVQGRIVLVLSGAPEGHRPVHRTEKMTLAARAGASAMILINGPRGNIIQTGTVSVGSISKIPAVGISREDGDWLVDQVKTGKRLRLQLTVTTNPGRTSARNIVGEIPGQGSDEIVMIGAHLDSWDLASGAMDNGVGTAVVLETARALAASGLKPRRTVRFVLFMAEELGLYGSAAYVKAHERQLGKIVMVLNLDMVGNPQGFRLHACDEAVPFFEKLAKELALEAKVESKAGLHSDHQPFMLAGVPAMELKSKLDDEQSKYYHSSGDHFGLVKGEYLDNAARVAAAALVALANAEARPAPWLTRDETRRRMERDDVKEALQLFGEWPFD